MKKASALLWRVVVSCLLLVTGYFVMPEFVSRKPSYLNTVANNLRQLDGAVQIWSLEHKVPDAVQPTWRDIAPYIKFDLGEEGSKFSIAGEQYILKPVPQSPEAVLTRRVDGYAKGTIIRFSTDRLDVVPPP